MATDVERLVVSLEASITKYERAMQRALGQTNNTARRIEQRFEQTNKQVATSFASIGSGIQLGLAKAFAGAAALRGAQQIIDASTRIENSLKVTGLSGDDLARVYDKLFSSAQRNMAPIETLATLYSRLGLAQKELGVSNDDLLSFTDNVALALRVQGSTAQEASGALIQLSQAMGSGIVRAEEFNSVVEGAPTILRATAAGLVEAGGSVSKLRQLVIDGKLSSEAFFRAFQAGSVILTGQVANAEVTVSNGLVRLQNVLIDAAGKFNDATGASESFVGTLDRVSTAIERLEGSKILSWLGNLNRTLETSGFLQFESSLREVEALLKAIDGAAGAVASSFDGAADSTRAAVSAALGYENIADAPGAFRKKIEELSTSLNSGKTDADELRKELESLGASPLNLAIQIGQIMELAKAAATARGAVSAIAGGGAAADGIALQRGEQTGLRTTPSSIVKSVSIEDYAPPTKANTGKGKKTGPERFAEAIADQEREIAILTAKTALQKTLNPLVNDYGFAVERLKVQQELENAATKADLALTPERVAQISALSEGYASATVEAAKLAEAQNATVQQMEDLRDASREALDTIIDGFLEGRDAGEIFGNVLKDIGKQLISIGLDSAFGTGQGANPFGFIGKALGFADGGYTGAGGRNQPAGVVHKGEVVWSQHDVAKAGGVGVVEAMRRGVSGYENGGVVSMPRLPAISAPRTEAGGGFTYAPTIDARGADQSAVDRIERIVARQGAEFERRVQAIVRGRNKKWV